MTWVHSCSCPLHETNRNQVQPSPWWPQLTNNPGLQHVESHRGNKAVFCAKVCQPQKPTVCRLLLPAEKPEWSCQVHLHEAHTVRSRHVRFADSELSETQRAWDERQGWGLKRLMWVYLSPYMEPKNSRECEEQQQQKRTRKETGTARRHELDWLNQPLCYLNGKSMFALSKGNKRKWVNVIEKHCRVCYNLASLDEHAQKPCQCVYCRWFILGLCFL